MPATNITLMRLGDLPTFDNVVATPLLVVRRDKKKPVLVLNGWTPYTARIDQHDPRATMIERLHIDLTTGWVYQGFKPIKPTDERLHQLGYIPPPGGTYPPSLALALAFEEIIRNTLAAKPLNIFIDLGEGKQWCGWKIDINGLTCYAQVMSISQLTVSIYEESMSLFRAGADEVIAQRLGQSKSAISNALSGK